MSIHLTIKNENPSNARTATPEFCLVIHVVVMVVGDLMSCGWKQGLGWGEKLSEEGSVKQTNYFVIHTETQSFFFFHPFVTCTFMFFEVMHVYLMDQYQNATSKAMLLCELKKVQLQECFTLRTQDSISYIMKMCCMSILLQVMVWSLNGKCCSSSLVLIEKMLAIQV